MQCSKCNYVMDDFDKECPRCHGKGTAKPTTPTPPTQPAAVPQTVAPSVNVGKTILIIGGVGCASVSTIAIVVVILLTVMWNRVSKDPVVADATANAQRASCQTNLKQLALATKIYIQTNNENYPDLSTADSIKAVLSAHTDNPDCFVCPTTSKPYRGNASLTGMNEGKISDSNAMIMFYEEDEVHKGGRDVAYVDGHVKWLKNDSWLTAKQASGIQ